MKPIGWRKEPVRHSLASKGIKTKTNPAKRRMSVKQSTEPTKDQKEFLKVIEGQEVWTNAFGKQFGERVCVGIENGQIACGGKRFKPTKKELKELEHDYLIQEYGTADFKEIMRIEGF